MTDPRRLWLLDRMQRTSDKVAQELVVQLAEQVAIATADAVTVRYLSPDGLTLVPMAVQHTDPHRAAAMTEVMGRTAESVGSGLWRPVMGSLAPLRWTVPEGEPPVDASAAQRDFLARHPVRAILGAPVLAHGEPVGGISLVRFTTTAPHTDEDERLLVDCAERIAPVLEVKRMALRDIGV